MIRRLPYEKRVAISVASPSQERVGSYRLLRMIGTGRVCELWEVNRSEGSERLAMKLIPPGANHTREQINILKREYQVGEQLSHPKVISTCDFVSGRHGTALVMELFRYPNLKQRIQSPPWLPSAPPCDNLER